MEKRIYSIYDMKGEYYLPLALHRTQAEAQRQFEQIIKMKETPMNKYPADYNLIELGTFNESTGVILPHETTKIIINGSEYSDILDA